MRLLRIDSDGEFSLVEYVRKDIPPYAILSHTWGEDHEEVSFRDFSHGLSKSKAGHKKLVFCGKRAAYDNLRYFWVDTCCIDKSSSAELQEAINSMFQWYCKATKCYAYLADVSIARVEGIDTLSQQAQTKANKQAFQESRWFTRGWTLQELLAPTSVEFFSAEGERLGDRSSLLQDIYDSTGISPQAIQGRPLNQFNIETRLSWAENRTTKREEDKAYALLGIFDVHMPLIYGEGEENAFRRLREEIDKSAKSHLHPQASVQPRTVEANTVRTLQLGSPASWIVPLPKPRFFVGRATQLARLRAHISSGAGQRLAIYGLGGCGKTALALETAYQTKEQEPTRAVFWVPTVSQESFEQAYRSIGALLRIPGITDNQADIKGLVKARLSDESIGQWLMIVDNADDVNVLLDPIDGRNGVDRLIDYLPRSCQGSIIFTTRTRAAAIKLAENNVIALGELEKSEAKDVLRTRLLQEHQHQLQEEETVDEFLNMLAFLALAIVQAVAFINTNDIALSDYITHYTSSEKDAIDLLGNEFEDEGRYPHVKNPVATTWYISFEHIRKRNELAADYLSFMACTANNDIPSSMLPASGSKIDHVVAIGVLKAYAFISERQQKDGQQSQTQRLSKAFDVHPLVHLAIRGWLKAHKEWNFWVKKTLARLVDIVPFGGYDSREVWTTYLPHAMHIVNLAEVCDTDDRMLLLERTGWCEYTIGRFEAAERVNRQLLEQRERLVGKEHPDTIWSMNELARALNGQGKYAESEQIDQEALLLSQKVLGKEDPNTLTTMDNLARVQGRQGKYAEAETMHRKVLELSTKVMGALHPDTLICRSNLAQVLSSQGKHTEATSMNQETLSSMEAVLGKEHVDTLISKSNLAVNLTQQGKYTEAVKMHQEVLAVRETLLGKEHPDTLTCMSNLSHALNGQGKYEEAEKMNQAILLLRVKILGRRHPDTLQSMNNLAHGFFNQRRYAEAEKMFKETITLREMVLGKQHPDTLTNVFWLAGILQRRKQYNDASQLYERALRGYQLTFGPDHPRTLACQNAQAANQRASYNQALLGTIQQSGDPQSQPAHSSSSEPNVK
ncbi:heterokaryon incompatibility protein-domain-containing protein [Pyrenochaeta sp. MPI-SDFR-AT-0127]|nr:heterokaryon incompatibility protein-domain-containing protein [Pyrenochaeta sp. MPI-SDFR-AT-0127]